MNAELQKTLELHGIHNAKECPHAHQLRDTGGVFFQSIGLMQCNRCKGWQTIRKPIN